jgi:5-methylcytosine-specific restriction protein A
MRLADVWSSDVIDAIREFDGIGREAFFDKYLMGEARSYMLHRDGHEYDSKAILAAAHGHHPAPAPLTAAQFSGGDHGAARYRYLRRLGFVVSSGTREPTCTRDELILACDLVLKNSSGWRSTRLEFADRSDVPATGAEGAPVHPHRRTARQLVPLCAPRDAPITLVERMRRYPRVSRTARV